jgi:hypothetical protein
MTDAGYANLFEVIVTQGHQGFADDVILYS